MAALKAVAPIFHREYQGQQEAHVMLTNPRDAILDIYNGVSLVALEVKETGIDGI